MRKIKILISLFVFFFGLNITYSYIENTQDLTNLNFLQNKIKTFSETKKEEIKILVEKNLNSGDERKEFYLNNLLNFLNQKETYKVLDVIDGDTIKILKNGVEEKIRLIGVDTPENSTTRFGYIEPLGKEAKEYLQNLIGNNEIEIETDPTQGEYDKYNRLLAFIFVNGQNLNLEIIKGGLAKEYTYNKPYKYQKEFKEAEEIAKNAKLGIWSDEYPELLENIEKNNSNPDYILEGPEYEGKIKGNVNSKKQKIYHYPGCKDYEKTMIRPAEGDRYFETAEEAKEAGFRVAGNC